jgi:hypothetical protein
MSFPVINLIHVVITAVVVFAFGAIWFGPLFGKQWMKMAKVTKKNGMNPAQAMILEYISTFIMTVFTAFFVYKLGLSSYLDGALLGVYLAVGFSATAALAAVLWEQKPAGLYIICVSQRIIATAIAGGLLTYLASRY